MKKLIVNIDLDGVCADLPNAIIDAYNNMHHRKRPDKYPILTIEDWTEYYLENILGQENITQRILAGTPGIFTDLAPMPDFAYYIKLISELPNLELRFVSQLPSISPSKALEEKLLWLHKHVFSKTNLVPASFIPCFGKDWVTGDIMIEDKVSNLLKFQGTRILVDWPYNRLIPEEQHGIIRLNRNDAWRQISIWLVDLNARNEKGEPMKEMVSSQDSHYPSNTIQINKQTDNGT